MQPPRGGGTPAPRRERPGVVRPVYEDFQPLSEWQQDDESHILNIYLPGFMKEQIKVLTEGKNTIRVRGERLVAGNKWSRFMENFQAPENGEMNSIRAKYQGGILTITIPKKEPQKPRKALPPQPKRDDIQKEPQKPREALPPQPKRDNIQKQPSPQKGQDKVSSEASTSQAKDETSLNPQNMSGDPRTIQGREGDGKQHVPQNSHHKDFPTYESVKNVVAQDAKESAEYKEKHIASERQHVQKKIAYDGGKKSADSKELSDIEIAKKTKLEKDGGAMGIPEKKADNKELYGAFTKEKYKKAVKGLAVLNEERQLLVNIGVALLVIVALTAQITYTFVTGNKKK